MDFLKVDAQPTLKAPIAICAFSGWNDAASAATNAARFIVRRLGARKFATIDAESFYDFKESRPTVRITARGDREVNWPTNDFFYARNPTGEHDVVVWHEVGGTQRVHVTVAPGAPAEAVLTLRAP